MLRRPTRSLRRQIFRRSAPKISEAISSHTIRNKSGRVVCYGVKPLNARRFASEIDRLMQLYDEQIVCTQLNVLGAHDTPRLLSSSGGPHGGEACPRLHPSRHPARRAPTTAMRWVSRAAQTLTAGAAPACARSTGCRTPYSTLLRTPPHRIKQRANARSLRAVVGELFQFALHRCCSAFRGCVSHRSSPPLSACLQTVEPSAEDSTGRRNLRSIKGSADVPCA